MQEISRNTSIGSEFVGIYNSNNTELVNMINTLTNRIKSVEKENTELKRIIVALQTKYVDYNALNSKLDEILEKIN